MTDNSTIELQTNLEEGEVSSSLKWEGELKRFDIPWINIPALYFAVFLSFPYSFTGITDFVESRAEQIQSEMTRSVSSQRRIGQRVSRSDALRIVRNILVQAERERLKIAEHEAEIGMQWEENL
jgi:hypothetical protein